MSINMKELALLTKDLKLLYIEDDKDARETTLKILKSFFKNITTAVDGYDGIEKFMEGDFDLILSDINMPRINGLEMLKIIREKDHNIPVLMLSAYDSSDYFIEAIDLDINGYILKPLMMDQFSKTILNTVKKMKLLAIRNNSAMSSEDELKYVEEDMKSQLQSSKKINLFTKYSFFKDKINSPVALLIDNEKYNLINETYGKEIGSEVLKKFIQQLGSALESDSKEHNWFSMDEFSKMEQICLDDKLTTQSNI